MNWETVTAVTDVAGLIAVVASLVYIGTQTKQTNDHATAASETAWMDALNRIWDSWAADERTILVLRQGFGSFSQLSKTDQATFHMKVGPLVNHWLLARHTRGKGTTGPTINGRNPQTDNFSFVDTRWLGALGARRRGNT